MKSYEPSTPRTAIGIIAVALTVLTIGLGVVLPAMVSGESDNLDLGVTAAYATVPSETPAASTVRYIEPIEVVVYRTREMTSIQNRSAPRGKQG